MLGRFVDKITGGGDPERDKQDQQRAELDRKQETELKHWNKELSQARHHDKPARARYAYDRRYAAGTSDTDWAVDANVIGTYIDILVDHLYAKNPDVSCRPSEEVNSALINLPLPEPDPALLAAGDKLAMSLADDRMKMEMQRTQRRIRRAERQDFAATLQIVVSKLWRRGHLKKAVRRQVRSALSVGAGWIKVVALHETKTDPHVQTELNDLRDNLERVQAKMKELQNAAQSTEETELLEAQLEEQIESLSPQLEVMIRKGLSIDFVPAEDMQVSTDVRYIDDYLEAGWLGNYYYIPCAKACEKLPLLTDHDVKRATKYYMRSPKTEIDPDESTTESEWNTDKGDDESANQYTSNDMTQNPSGQSDVASFLKCCEIWDKDAGVIRTLVEGVKEKYGRETFRPRYKAKRFYPYFYLAFYEVDGARHSQSMAGRLSKLGDEYASTRSSFRLTRERAIPGTLFDKTAIDPGEARTIEAAVHQEFVGLSPTNPQKKLSDMFAAKPIEVGDPILWDTTPITRDMEKISGVQEAQISSASRRPNMTATEASIEQGGFANRTQADQDTLDDMLDDLAEYSAEISMQCIDPDDASRMAGIDAFWPTDLKLEDITTMVEVEIEAGSTGRPNRENEMRTWSTVLPLIRQDIVAIQESRMIGNEPLALALTELLRETLRRMGDRADIERFIPDPMQTPPLNPANSGLGEEDGQQAGASGDKPPGGNGSSARAPSSGGSPAAGPPGQPRPPAPNGGQPQSSGAIQ